MTTSILYEETAYELSQSTHTLAVDITDFDIEFEAEQVPARTLTGDEIIAALTPTKPQHQLVSAYPFQILPRPDTQVQYRIEDRQLLLSEIRLMGQAEAAPILDGIAPQVDPFDNTFYAGLSHPVPFSGKLLLVRDFFRHNCIGRYHLHPFQRIEAYDYILELMLDSGQLVSTIDHSETIAALRTMARRWWYGYERVPEVAFLEHLGEWVQAIYGPDYDAWWLPTRDRASA